MKEDKYYMTFDKYEHGLTIHALNELRTQLLDMEKETSMVDELLLKTIQAPTKKFRVYEHEQR